MDSNPGLSHQWSYPSRPHIVTIRAGQYIAWHCYAHLVSKASYSSSKSPSPAFRWNIWCRYDTQ